METTRKYEAPKMDLSKVAVILMTRPARKPESRKVHAAVLARVEIALAIESALKS